jgi:steroid delta-isomerase-like uncharacterized protein
MSASGNRVRIERAFDAIFNEGRLDEADALFEPDARFHSPAQPEPFVGPEGFKAFVGGLRAAFPDMRVTIEDLIAEGDIVALRAQIRATHTGVYRGIPPTLRTIAPSEMVMVRMRAGRVAEAWQMFDGLTVMRQLGVFPRGDPPPLLMRLVVALQRIPRAWRR